MAQGKIFNESLNYKVLYKWGIIQKQAGHGTLTLNVKGNQANAFVTAQTEHWADRFYRLRDTIYTSFDMRTQRPSVYKLVQHEKKRYSKDVVRFVWDGDNVKGMCSRLRKKDMESESVMSELTLEASGVTVDLLSSFYYVRMLPFEKLQKGYVEKLNIFSGKKKEILTIRYLGKETITFNDAKTPTFKVEFTFTTDGGKQSSDPIEAWLLTDESHIPLKIVGKLKVGQIQCLYVP